MKTSLANPFFLSILLVGFSSMATRRASAQTFTTLRSFTATSASHTNADGYYLNAALLLSGNRLYGVTLFGGAYGNGTVFALNTDGTAFTNLHRFAPTSGGSLPNFQNLDGINPQGDLVLSGNTLYGTAPFGGANGSGTIFAISTDGTGFTNLCTFNTNGSSPYGGLVLSGSTLFGTTINTSGSYGDGTVFAINTDGTGFTNLHSFNGIEGANPYGGLALSSNTLFGTTMDGGRFAYGTVFAINTDGTGFTNLHSFKVNEGVTPFAGLIFSSNKLYGTTQTGGRLGYGTVFAVNIDGTGFTNLHSFNQTDGWEPQARLILSGNTLYGTTTYGGIGPKFNGTVFAVNIDGTGFTNLHKFTLTTGSQGDYGVNSDGGFPVGGLIVSSNSLFGTTHMGGNSGSGTIFTISFMPQLALAPSGPNLVFTWPTDYAGFDYGGFTLQSTTNLTSPVWTTNLPAPVLVNGQNTVTNPISGTRQFFRLSW
jgi:uncharacterized repeat protein (TIGR03803 family)